MSQKLKKRKNAQKQGDEELVAKCESCCLVIIAMSIYVYYGMCCNAHIIWWLQPYLPTIHPIYYPIYLPIYLLLAITS